MHDCEFCGNEIDYHEIIDCITCALDARDPYTAGHSERVSDMVLKASFRLPTETVVWLGFQYFELPHSGHSLQNDTAISKQWMDAVVEYLDKYMPVR